MAQCSCCFRHTKHLLVNPEHRIFKCEFCSKTTLPWSALFTLSP